jgi:four helix bundle protein
MKNRFTFRLYGVSLDTARLVAPRLTELARHDADLGRQARRALHSMHLNIAEAIDAAGGNRTSRMRTALGSTNEVIACLDLGVVLGYVAPEEAAMDGLSRVRATLLELVMTKR